MNQIKYTDYIVENITNGDVLYSLHMNRDKIISILLNGLWMNRTNEKSLRLTEKGFSFIIKNTSLTPHKIKLTEKIMPKQLLLLEKSFSGAYLIDNLKTLILFGEEDIIALTLRDGNLHQYLDQFN